MAVEKDSRRFGRKAISVEEARTRALQAISAVGTEKVDLLQASGRRSAADVFSEEPVPSFRRSGMDGFAVRAVDTAPASTDSPVRLKVVDDIPAGQIPRRALASGEAARIMTGAMIPEGADAVVMLEMTDTEEGGGEPRIVLKRAIKPGANVSEAGSDVALGELLLKRGAWIGASEIALLATVGKAGVSVYRRPRVAIVATGSELLRPDEPLISGKIRNSNSYMLAAQAGSAGAAVTVHDIMPDELDLLLPAVRRLMDENDLVITTGGVSVGDYDVMTDLLHEWGGQLLFNKIQMRPGSVTSAAVANGKLLFGLSGNPGACFAGFELLVRPVLKALQGAADPHPREVMAAIGEDYPKVNAYPRYLRGRLSIEDGRAVAAATKTEQSSRLLPGLGANAFMVIPPGGNGVPKGTLIPIVLLEE